MTRNTGEEPSGGKTRRRPAFNIFDWVVAALSIALFVFLLLNLPDY